MESREPGAVLDGKYEIVQRLGSGGMGEVYLVRHVHLQELRVVKILRQDLAADDSAQKRFLREARLATQIKHPNVAILYDFAMLPEGSFYMVWEHIEGEDVGEFLRKHGPAPVPVGIELGIQALRGLEAIHTTGVIHRDISPDNIMITRDRRGRLRVKIIDLGLAKNLERDTSFEITQVGMFMGKLQYCSPEQAGAVSGESLDRRSDLYSFALVLYEMMTGLPPFDSETQSGFIFKRLSEDPLPLVGRNPRVEVPAELDRVVRKALERDRDRRYPDAVSFIADLERVGIGLRAAETKEIPVAGVARTAAAAPATAAPGAPAPPRQRSSSELSREEKLDLLAQIERAAQRSRETTKIVAQAEVALDAGRIDQARELLRQAEAASSRVPGLDRVRQRLAEIDADRDRERRAGEAEQVLAGYLQKKQLPLARLALETLLELAPEHPRRADYEARLAALGGESERAKRVERAVDAGRDALVREDVGAARRELEVIAGEDAERARAFEAEIQAVERSRRESADVGERRRRLEKLLAGGEIAAAAAELERLAALDLPRVTVDDYRARLAEVRATVERQRRAGELETELRSRLGAGDWMGAREAALELERVDPASRRSAEWLAEVDRRETEGRKRQSIEQGERQIETFLKDGDWYKAEVALKVLVQMDPGNKNRKRFEKQIQALLSRP